ncbi:MAG: hypothetical protein WCF90_01130, partial [Methanomicrobiales archaeon]
RVSVVTEKFSLGGVITGADFTNGQRGTTTIISIEIDGSTGRRRLHVDRSIFDRYRNLYRISVAYSVIVSQIEGVESSPEYVV